MRLPLRKNQYVVTFMHTDCEDRKVAGERNTLGQAWKFANELVEKDWVAEVIIIHRGARAQWHVSPTTHQKHASPIKRLLYRFKRKSPEFIPMSPHGHLGT